MLKRFGSQKDIKTGGDDRKLDHKDIPIRFSLKKQAR